MSGGGNVKPDPNGTLFDRLRTGGLLGANKSLQNGQPQPTILKTIMAKTQKPLGLGG